MLTEAMTIPNLPGNVIQTDSWLYRNSTNRGNLRPQSASATNLRHSASDVIFPTNNQRSSSAQRPTTAGTFRGLQFSNTGSKFAAEDAGASYTRALSAQALNSPGIIKSASRPSTAGADRASSLLKQMPSPTPVVPKFVEKDRMVARLYGHFYTQRNWETDGAVSSTPFETTIGRRITLFYYFVDDSVEIIEEKSQNTGIRGGKFFNRGVLLKPNKEPVTLIDMTPGNSFHALGHLIHITDADPFTRNYFRRELKMVLPAPLERPEIVREEYGAQYATGLGQVAASRQGHFGTCSNDYAVTKERFDKTYKFLHLDGRVLRFEGVEIPVVDGQLPEEFQPTSSMRKYVLSYYLADNSIELRAMKGDLEDAKLVLKRNKLARNWREVQAGAPPVLFEPEDFVCGGTLDVYGRVFLLLSCDSFSRQVYDELGIYQGDVQVVEEVPQVVLHPVPKVGDGYLQIGRPEDTLATCYGQPKVTKNLKKNPRNQNRMLRCKLKYLSENKINATRMFMLTFFLEDDTVQVYEEVARNAGIVGGTFLKRSHVMNDLPPDGDEPRQFKAQDIYLGNVISFNGNEMQIVEMDNLSLQFCEAYPEEYPMFDTFTIAHRLMNKARSLRVDIRGNFLRYDSAGHGWVDRDTFIAALDAMSLSENMNDQEALTLMRRFKSGEKFMYHELADLFSHVFAVGTKKDKRKSSLVLERASDLSAFIAMARTRSTQWRRTLRKDPAAANGKIPLSQLVKVFNFHGLATSRSVNEGIKQSYRVDRPAEGAVNAAAAAARADFRSRSRAETSVGGKSGTKKVQTIKMKRQALSRSVLRPNVTMAVEFEPEEENDDNVIIDYQLLCDDIYICNWV